MTSVLPLQRKPFIRIWITAIASIYLALGVLAVSTVAGERRAASRDHALRMNPNGGAPGKTRPDPLPANGDFTNVSVGIYLDGIDDFSIKDSAWTANFYVWFRWKGDPSLEPGESFHFVDAKIEWASTSNFSSVCLPAYC